MRGGPDCIFAGAAKRRRTVVHAQRKQQAFFEKVLERRASGAGDDLAGDDVHQIVVGILRAKAGAGFQVSHGANDFFARSFSLREHQQVTGTERQPAPVCQQVPDRELPGYPGIVHAKIGKVVDNRIVPTELSFINKDRQCRCCERLRYRRDLKQRFVVDPGRLVDFSDAVSFGVVHRAVEDNRDAHTRNLESIE